MELLSCITYECMNVVYEIKYSALCLRDPALKLNLPFDMCRWLVESEDVEIVHEVLVRHHQLLTSGPLLRP